MLLIFYSTPLTNACLSIDLVAALLNHDFSNRLSTVKNLMYADRFPQGANKNELKLKQSCVGNPAL